ncbi:4318_t:CDS:1, partial [Dentiscutata heterogama]
YISHNYIFAISFGSVINSPGASSDSNNYLEFGAVVSDIYFVFGSALSGFALSGFAPNTYFGFGSGSGTVASNTNAITDTNQYATPDANRYSASDTNHYAAPNTN